MDNTKDFTTSQAAEYLNYAHNTMNVSRSTGRLGGREAPKFFKYQGQVFYKKSSCDEWMKEGSIEATKTGTLGTLGPLPKTIVKPLSWEMDDEGNDRNNGI